MHTGKKYSIIKAAPVSTASTKPAASNFLDSSILLISDDDPHWDKLAERGYRILRARNVEESAALFSQDPGIAVVIVDLDLKDCDGIALIEALREPDGAGQGAEFLLVAGHDALAGAVRAVKLQVLDFLVRPFDEEELATAVSDAYNVARLKRFQREEARQLETLLAEFKMRTHTAVSQLIARAQGAYNIAGPVHQGGVKPGSTDDTALQDFIREENQRARLREKVFGPLAQNHSVWMLLLALWDSQLAGTELTIKSVAYSAGLPLSSALRKINELCAGGLVRRRGDPDDARRSFVALTPQGQSYFARFFSEWNSGREARKLASGE
jgi:ActR/RegA family two-component response regulator/DNA-binding MarR family transcriptional regulator